MSRPIGDVNGTSQTLPTKVKDDKTLSISDAMFCTPTTTDLFYLQNKSRREAQAKRDVFAFFIDGVAFAGFCRDILVYFLENKTRNRFKIYADHLLMMMSGGVL